MNILAIGNGFDLAHGLNTSYMDFLKVIDTFSEKIDLTNGPDAFLKKYKGMKIENKVREYIFLKWSNALNDDKLNRLIEIKEKNFWIWYFIALLDEKEKPKNTWIDFESQIKYVIVQLENAINSNTLVIGENKIEGISPQISTYLLMRKPKFDHYNEIIELLENDLNELIYCLEIYLVKFINDTVNEGLVEAYSPDIQNTSFDKVLSFNYTKTFELLYDRNKNIEYHYIHTVEQYAMQLKDFFSFYFQYTPEQYANELLGQADQYLIEEKIEILPVCKDAQFHNILETSIKKLPPFEGVKGKADKGFKDAVIWFSLIDYAKDHPADYIFVTKDKIFQDNKNKKWLYHFFEENTGQKITFYHDTEEVRQNIIEFSEESGLQEVEIAVQEKE